MPQFTNPSLAKWQSVDFLNEIITSYNEHRRALGDEPIAMIAAGDNIQRQSLWRGIQNWILQNATKFVNHTIGPTWFDAAPFYTAETFFSVAGVPHVGTIAAFRRSVDGENFGISRMQVGDVIGPWIFEDIQRCLDAMRWTAHTELTIDSITREIESFEKSGTTPRIHETPEAAYNAAVADYNGQDWNDAGGAPYSVLTRLRASGDPLLYDADVSRVRMTDTYTIPENTIAHEAEYYAQFEGSFVEPFGFDNVDNLSPEPVDQEYILFETFAMANTTTRIMDKLNIMEAPPIAPFIGPAGFGTRLVDLFFVAPVLLVKWDWTYTL